MCGVASEDLFAFWKSHQHIRILLKEFKSCVAGACVMEESRNANVYNLCEGGTPMCVICFIEEHQSVTLVKFM